jgi:CheY-like chemotaxis protein
MGALRVVVLESDGGQWTALVAGLRQLGVEQVWPVRDGAAAIRDLSLSSADLVLCSLNMGDQGCLDLLRKLAMVPAAPAVAIHGPAEDLIHAENLCQRLGLRYLGHLSYPLQEERLQRMVQHLRAFHAPSRQA